MSLNLIKGLLLLKYYLLLAINITLLITFLADVFNDWNSVCGIVGFFCPFVSAFSLSYMMAKDWINDIHIKINVIGQTLVGFISVGYIAFIFLIL